MIDGSAAEGHGKCDARKKQGDGPCGRPAGWGTNHPGVGRCKLHGGSTTNHVKAGQRLLVEREARRAFGRLVDVSTPVTDPLGELAKLAGDVVAWKTFLAGRIEGLEGLTYESEFSGEQIKGEIQLFTQALTLCNTVLVSMAKLNIDERMAAISERQGDMLAGAVSAILDRLGLSREQRDLVPTVVPAVMRQITQGERAG